MRCTVNNEKRQKNQLGEEVTFTNRENTSQTVAVKVVGFIALPNPSITFSFIIILQNLAALIFHLQNLFSTRKSARANNPGLSSPLLVLELRSCLRRL